MYNYSTVNKENLQKLHDFCPKMVNLGMGGFAEDDIDAVTATPEHPCETAACVVGNGPSAGVPVQPEFIRKTNVRVYWFGYSQENFISGTYNPLWQFAFSARWNDCPKEAQARLKLVLDEQVPEKWTHADRFASVD